MGQYKFVTPNEEPENSWPLVTIFDGTRLDNIAGFPTRTLKVEGRALTAQEVQDQDRPWNDGAWFLGSRVPKREIKITMLVDLRHEDGAAKTDRTFWEELNKTLIGQEPKELKFTDDDYSFFAIYTGFNQIAEDTYQEKFELQFSCPDPFKYKPQTEISKGTVNAGLLLPTLPDKAEITIKEAAELVRITNATMYRNITIKGPFQAGDVLTITWGDIIQIKNQEDENILPRLDILSQIEDFKIMDGQQITALPASTEVRLKVRAKAL
jgi:predicted phage tail component-like protein